MQILTFKYGTEVYGVPIDLVDSIINMPTEVAEIPGGGEGCLGMVQVLDKIMVVRDFGSIFLQPVTSDEKPTEIIVSIKDIGYAVDKVLAIEDVDIEENIISPSVACLATIGDINVLVIKRSLWNS